jgi:hypothetical protein
MLNAKVMENRIGTGRRFNLRSNRAAPTLRRQACRAIAATVKGGCSDGRSSSVKPGQTSFIAQAGDQNPWKPLKANGLQNKQLWSGQTIVNLVKYDQKEQ